MIPSDKEQAVVPENGEVIADPTGIADTAKGKRTETVKKIAFIFGVFFSFWTEFVQKDKMV